MLIRIRCSNLSLKHEIVSEFKSFGFKLSHFKRDNDHITELYFDLQPYMTDIVLIEKGKPDYLLESIYELTKKYKDLSLDFVSEDSVKNLPAYAEFVDPPYKIEVVLPKGIEYNYGEKVQMNFRIKNEGDKPISFKKLNQTYSAIRIDDINDSEIVFMSGNDLAEPEDVVINPGEEIVEQPSFVIDVEQSVVKLIPMTTMFKIGEAQTQYFLPPIKILIKHE